MRVELAVTLGVLQAAAGIVDWTNSVNFGATTFTNSGQHEQVLGPVLASRNGLLQPAAGGLQYGWTLRNFLPRALEGDITNDFALAIASNRFVSFTIRPVEPWGVAVSEISMTLWHRENWYLYTNLEYGVGLYTDAHGDNFSNLLTAAMWVPPITNWYTNLVLTVPDLGVLTNATTFRLATIQSSNHVAYFVYGFKDSPEGTLALEVRGSIVPEPAGLLLVLLALLPVRRRLPCAIRYAAIKGEKP